MAAPEFTGVPPFQLTGVASSMVRQEIGMTSQQSAIFSTPGLSSAGGKEVQEHHGWQMPALYSDPATEYAAAKEDVAVLDSSSVGRL